MADKKITELNPLSHLSIADDDLVAIVDKSGNETKKIEIWKAIQESIGVGDITGVEAGDGLTGGGNVGQVSLDVEANSGGGLSVTPDGIGVATQGITGSMIGAGSGSVGQVLTLQASWGLAWEDAAEGDMSSFNLSSDDGASSSISDGEYILYTGDDGIKATGVVEGNNYRIRYGLFDGGITEAKLDIDNAPTTNDILSWDGTKMKWVVSDSNVNGGFQGKWKVGSITNGSAAAATTVRVNNSTPTSVTNISIAKNDLNGVGFNNSIENVMFIEFSNINGERIVYEVSSWADATAYVNFGVSTNGSTSYPDFALNQELMIGFLGQKQATSSGTMSSFEGGNDGTFITIEDGDHFELTEGAGIDLTGSGHASGGVSIEVGIEDEGVGEGQMDIDNSPITWATLQWTGSGMEWVNEADLQRQHSIPPASGTSYPKISGTVVEDAKCLSSGLVTAFNCVKYTYGNSGAPTWTIAKNTDTDDKYAFGLYVHNSSVNAGYVARILIDGFYERSTGTWATSDIGKNLYLHTDGTLTTTRPTASTSFVQVMGKVVSQTRAQFKPSDTIIENS